MDTVARDEEQAHVEALWMPSARAYQQRKEEEHRAAWCEHYRRMRGAAEKAWSIRVEVTYGLAWDRQRQAWVAPDDFGYVPPEEEREGVA